MFFHAQLNESFICDGFGDLKSIESAPNLVYLPDGWDENLLWRKYENGVWSVVKFEPVQPTAEELKQQRILALKAELALLQS